MRLGVIGAGAIAARHLAVMPEADGEVKIVAHLSRRIERAEAAATAFGGLAFDDLERFIGANLDSALVTVPPAQHGAVERALIAARIPFLVEKPLAIDAELPRALGEAIDAAGLVVAVGYNWRALDTLDEVRRLLGETPARMVMGRFHIGTPPAPWWRFEAGSGGQMLEQACHLIDLARHLLGEGKLLGAAGSFGPFPGFDDGDIAGSSAALLQFGNVPAVMTATALLPGGPGAELRLICLGREIVITLAGVQIIEGGKQRFVESRSSYVAQHRRFFAAVRSGRADDVFCTYRDALVTHRLCLDIGDAIQQSR